jgi:hypothetical protein
VIPPGIVHVTSPEFENKFAPTVVTLCGIIMFRNIAHFSNTVAPIESSPSLKTTARNAVHVLKALAPIVVIFE